MYLIVPVWFLLNIFRQMVETPWTHTHQALKEDQPFVRQATVWNCQNKSLYFEAGAPTMGEVFWGNTVCTGIQHAAFVHIPIANHTTLNCASNIYLSITFTWTGSYIVRLLKCKRAKISLTSLKFLQHSWIRKKPKELKFAEIYCFHVFILNFSCPFLAKIKASAAIMRSLKPKENAQQTEASSTPLTASLTLLLNLVCLSYIELRGEYSMCLLCSRWRAKGVMSCQFSPQFPLLSSSDAAITQTCQKQDDTKGKDKRHSQLVQTFLKLEPKRHMPESQLHFRTPSWACAAL